MKYEVHALSCRLSSSILKFKARERGRTVHINEARATSLFLPEVNNGVLAIGLLMFSWRLEEQ